jgi:hypothetical protein
MTPEMREDSAIAHEVTNVGSDLLGPKEILAAIRA